MGAEAEMGAPQAESEMAVRLASHIEPVGIRELVLIAIT
jgi:hypothetical protein